MSKKNIEGIYPLSGSQPGMLFETLLSVGSEIHIEQSTWAWHGYLDIKAFEQTWQRIVERHSILRTGFVWKEQAEPLMVVLREIAVSIAQQDWRGLDPQEQQRRLIDFMVSDRTQGFQLSKPPLMRLTLLRMDDERYEVVWTLHHILMDGWCQPIIFQELLSFYQAFSKGQDLYLEASRPYRDYITWLKQQDISQAEQFWRKNLQGFTQPTPLGKVVVNGFADSAEVYREYTVSLDAETLQKLRDWAKTNRLTLNALVQAAWALLLSRYTAEADVVFGITVSGRPPDLVGVELMIGLFINTLPLRVQVPADTSILDWLKDLQAHNFELRQYEYTPSGQIHQWSELKGGAALYESILVFQNYPTDLSADQFSDLNIDIHHTNSQGARTKYPLTLLVSAEQELILHLVYDQRRFDQVTVNKILKHFQTIMQTILQQPSINVKMLWESIPSDEIPQYLSVTQSHPQKSVYTNAPRNPLEQVIATIYTQVLNVDHIDHEDNFFELGGHSLLATQVISRLRETFNQEIPLRCLFEFPTVAGLAEYIHKAKLADQELEEIPLQQVDRTGNLPVSYAQQRLWFLNQLDTANVAYNDSDALLLKGELNLAALEQSFQEIIRRHEILRTTFSAVDAEPIQVIHPTRDFQLSIVDFTNLANPHSQLSKFFVDEAQHPFDLERDLLLRVNLVQLGDSEYALQMIMHHIISDAWSMGVLVRELTTLYKAFCAGQPSPLPQLPIQYADFAVWQRKWLQGKVLQKQLGYWKQQLGSNLPVLKLPTDYPRPAGKSVQSPAATVNFKLSQERSRSLQQFSRQEVATLFMTLFAAFQTLLHRYTGATDIVVGTDVANRNRVETEGLIGFFVNLLVLRTDLSGNPTFRELLQRVREVALSAYAHQDLPFEKLVAELRPERSLSQTPLFQVLFVMQNAPMPTLEVSGLTLSPWEIENETAKFDLAVFIAEAEHQIVGSWKYNADVFDAATITKMSNHFETLLDSIVKQPDARLNTLEMLTTDEKQQQALQENKREKSNFSKFKSIKPKAIRLSEKKLIKTEYLQPEQTLPLVIKPVTDDIELIDWAKSSREFIESKLLEHGAILFRGFKVNSVTDFEQFAQAICPNLFAEYGDLPREEMGGKVYGSTPYPADKTILFHNESSHLHCYPMKIWFFCVQPAEVRGETPIVDCRKIYQLLEPELIEQFTQKQLMYVRNYTPGIDVSWQDFFHTKDKTVVEDYCRKHRINFEWKNSDVLQTRELRPAVAKHPKSGEMVFFNQLQLHHIYCMEPEMRESLLSLFGLDNLPRHVYYGDASGGSRSDHRTPIPDSVIDKISAIYQQATISFPWQKGDILMLDNMLTAHGRNPYIGSRKIVVALGEMVSQENIG
ncbi:MAG: condensation domain-containing protein [Hassallia sp.]